MECHGSKREGDFDLRTRQTILVGSETGSVVKVGSAESSKLYDLVYDEKMPPKGPLTDDEVDVIRRWIDDGLYFSDIALTEPEAENSPWWSTSPITETILPADVNPVDDFVVGRLKSMGLDLSPAADSRTILRRLTYDLHGLPPTPEQMQTFRAASEGETGDADIVGDGAYSEMVEQLLSSPRYGERWARHWLDVAHYGETHGFDKDHRRNNAWPYRDYVIRALNNDKPYSKFVREQIAGDVIGADDPESIVATGFLAAGPWDQVGHLEVRDDTIEKKRVRNLDRDDIVTSVFNTFQSTTVQCARCHTHKFDPISREDYYRLQATFAGLNREDRTYEDTETARKRLHLSTEITKSTQKRDAVWQRIVDGLPREYAKTQRSIERLTRTRKSLKDKKDASPTNGYHSVVTDTPDAPQWVEIELERAQSIDRVVIYAARPTDFRDSPGFGFPLRYAVRVDGEDGGWITLVDHTDADVPNPGDTPLVLDVNGQKIKRVRVDAYRLWERDSDFAFALAEVQVYAGEQNVATGAQVNASSSIDFGRWHTRYLVDGYDSRKPLVAGGDTSVELASLDQELAQLRWVLNAIVKNNADPQLLDEHGSLESSLAALTADRDALPELKKLYAFKTREPRPVFDLVRGNESTPREQVIPGALSLIPHIESKLEYDIKDEAVARRAMAAWIASPENPLTWRSAANRVWQYHFGKGLVSTPNDFGRAGALPTHPELLDWLAGHLRETDSLKSLHRVILLSDAYRQLSRSNPQGVAKDSENRFLWRMNVRKLEAETVRDAILQISGKMDWTMGGPSFEAFNYTHDHSPRYDFLGNDSPEVWRRSVYRFIVRSVPDPYLEALDCADPNLSVPVRNETMTAPQALAMLNDAFVLKQAEYTAENLTSRRESTSDQISELYRAALGREPSEVELQALISFAERNGMAAVSRVTFNLNEFMFVD